MAEIIDLHQKRRSLAAKRGFRTWLSRFSETLHENTRIEDLSDVTLGSLIRSGEETEKSIHEFIMGVKGMGSEDRFNSLEMEEKMMIMDIGLFLLDQLRFECMRRLGWIEAYPGLHVPLIDLVDQFSGRFSDLKHQTPLLSSAHPRYSEYTATFKDDRGAFIRRLVPEAIELFRKKSRK